MRDGTKYACGDRGGASVGCGGAREWVSLAVQMRMEYGTVWGEGDVSGCAWVRIIDRQTDKQDTGKEWSEAGRKNARRDQRIVHFTTERCEEKGEPRDGEMGNARDTYVVRRAAWRLEIAGD